MNAGFVYLSLSLTLKNQSNSVLTEIIRSFRGTRGWVEERAVATLPTVGNSLEWEQTWCSLLSLGKSPAGVRCSKDTEGKAIIEKMKKGSEKIAVDGWREEEAHNSSVGNMNSLTVFPRTTHTIFCRLAAFSWQCCFQNWAGQGRKNCAKIYFYLFLSLKLIFCIFQHWFFIGIPICLRHFLYYFPPCLFSCFYNIGIQNYISCALKTFISAFLVALLSYNVRRVSHLNCVSPQLFPFSPFVAVGIHSPWTVRHGYTLLRDMAVFQADEVWLGRPDKSHWRTKATNFWFTENEEASV